MSAGRTPRAPREASGARGARKPRATLSPRSTLADVARCVGEALRADGILAVLTGGACAHLYTRGRFASGDLDFVIQTAVAPSQLDAVMASAGFARQGNSYVHARAPYIVEFPRGPLGIGADLSVKPVSLRIGSGRVLALSATDSCRDRLAAFYHWGDRQGLRAAVGIARRHRVDLKRIRDWSAREGFSAQHEEFVEELRKALGKMRAPSRSRP